MQQTEQRPAPSRASLFRRLLFGETEPSGQQAVGLIRGLGDSRERIIDARPGTSSDFDLHQRMEHLETGVRLIADTLRRACNELLGAMARRQTQEGGVTERQVERIVAQAMEPLTASVERLRYRLEASTLSAPAGGLDPPDHEAEYEQLHASPFELEPLDKGFGPDGSQNWPDLEKEEA